MKEDIKTRQQEKAYHKLFSQIADHCVAHGVDVKMAIEKLERYRPDITKEFVKSSWRAILYTLTEKESTTEQTREDVKAVQQEFGKVWTEITGISFDWPSIENQMLTQYDDNGNFTPHSSK
jgi:hypothetical protein